MEQPITNLSDTVEGTPRCPRCGLEGRTVGTATIESLVTPAARARFRSLDGFRFCATPACDATYFHPNAGEIISCADVMAPIFQKHTHPGRLVCYCFQHTVAAVQQEVRATGHSHIAADIKAKCAHGLADCERTNPQGACCLGNIQRVIREAGANPQPPPADGGVCCCH